MEVSTKSQGSIPVGFIYTVRFGPDVLWIYIYRSMKSGLKPIYERLVLCQEVVTQYLEVSGLLSKCVKHVLNMLNMLIVILFMLT